MWCWGTTGRHPEVTHSGGHVDTLRFFGGPVPGTRDMTGPVDGSIVMDDWGLQASPTHGTVVLKPQPSKTRPLFYSAVLSHRQLVFDLVL